MTAARRKKRCTDRDDWMTRTMVEDKGRKEYGKEKKQRAIRSSVFVYLWGDILSFAIYRK